MCQCLQLSPMFAIRLGTGCSQDAPCRHESPGTHNRGTSDARRTKILCNDLPFWHGPQLVVDTTCVSRVTRCGRPRQGLTLELASLFSLQHGESRAATLWVSLLRLVAAGALNPQPKTGQSLVLRHMGMKGHSTVSLMWHRCEIIREHFVPPNCWSLLPQGLQTKPIAAHIQSHAKNF